MVGRKNILVRGVGINDANYEVATAADEGKAFCHIYITWAAMLGRVYSEYTLKNHPSYRDCSVCDEWLLFSNFRLWMICQDWKGKQLDKDILIPGNKKYSPETCCFVDQKLNNLLIHNQLTKSFYPAGVHFNKNRDKYIARVRVDGVQQYLGSFSTPELAEIAYIEAKAENIRCKGRLQTSPIIMIGLFRHAYVMEQKLIQLEKQE